MSDESQTELTAQEVAVLEHELRIADTMLKLHGRSPACVIQSDVLRRLLAARRAVKPSPDLRTALSRWVPAALLEQALADVSAVGWRGEGREAMRECTNDLCTPSATEGLETGERLLKAWDKLAPYIRTPMTRSEAGIHAGRDDVRVVKTHLLKTFVGKVEKARAALAAARQASAESGVG